MANKRQSKKANAKPIRIDKPTTTEYRRLIKNSKAKVNRTLKNHNIDLTEYAGIKPLESFQTRAEFNEWKRQQAWFTNKSNDNYQFVKNPHGISAPKSMLKRITKNTKATQRNVDKLVSQTENLPFHTNLKPTGESVKDRRAMQHRPTTAGISRPLDFDFNRITSVKQLLDKDENMARKATGEHYDKRMVQLRENFIEHVSDSFNSNADELIQMIRQVPPDDFFEMYLMFDEFAFDIYYTNDNLINPEKDYISVMKEYIRMYKDGEINLDLKGF